MSEEAALLAAVKAAPADDLPRLVLADWYEENGQPERAEFIRVQCELERTRGDFDQAARHEWLCERSAQLRHVRDEKGRLVQRTDWACGLDGSQAVFHRGFVVEARVTLGDWETVKVDLLSEHPVERVTLTDRFPQDYHNNAPHLNPNRLHGWYLKDHTGSSHHDLPPAVWYAVCKHPRCLQHGRWADFEQRADALAAVSDGLLSLAQEATHV